MSRPALLDVNVLVALFDPGHIHHESAHDWFADERTAGWATCPVTENGFVRVVTNVGSRMGGPRSPDIVERLRSFCESGHHVFWPDAVSLRNKRLFNLAVVRGHGQLTDVYLLGLAKHMGGRLATFDRTIPLTAVAGATPDTIAIVAPAE